MRPKLRISLVFPAIGKKTDRPYVAYWKEEPLFFAVLAALTPPGHEIRFYDDRLENIPFDERTDLVAISVETHTARRAYGIAAQFRQRGIPVVLGGIHPTLIPEEALEHGDAVVVGEAEGVWAGLLEDADRKQLKKIYAGQRLPLGDLIPDRTIYRDKQYLPVSLVESSRGCSFECQFCATTHFFDHTYRARPIRAVVKDIEGLRKQRIFFTDDNFTINAKRTKDLLKAFIPLKIEWTCQGSIHAAEDEELLALMRKSGCLGIFVGLESLNAANLRQMNKPVRDGGLGYVSAIQKFRGHGIAVFGAFVFGFDQDDRDSFERTLEFAIQQKLFKANFNLLAPYPGTPLYEQLERENRLIFRKWWLEPSFQYGRAAFHPRRMTAEALSDMCLETRRKFYSVHSLWKRLFDAQVHARDLWSVKEYLVSNIFSKQSVEERHGLPLG